MTSRFILSLDFELLWGLRDHADRTSYGRNILGAREVIPRMLDLFAARGVSATWATVGMLMAEGRDELLEVAPPEDERPQYANPRLSNYGYLDEVGASEADDPHYFAPSLVAQIANTPGQEIGTHTFSHFYCLEPGATLHAFAADLAAARRIEARRGVVTRSIVFPRNQYGQDHIETCRRAGIDLYRGNPVGWAYNPAPGAGQSSLRRAARLIDAHAPLMGHHGQGASPDGNRAASLFLRPWGGRLAPFHARHVARIEAAMAHAVHTERDFHLWWHPHNFGAAPKENMAALERIVTRFETLRDEHGMVSASMADTAPVPPLETSI
jgi:peptidoglycan/xylan/chitin deacetylase (PgdA/CDA1 family)